MNFSIHHLKSFFRLALIVLLLASATGFSAAQNAITPAIRAQVSTELQKRGLNEAEVRTRLLQNGIDLENVPPAELPKYQGRVTAILDQMQAEKKQKAAGGGQPSPQQGAPAQQQAASQQTAPQQSAPQPVSISVETAPANDPTPALDQTPIPTAINAPEVPVEPVTTPQEAAAEAAQKVAQKDAAKRKTNIYGHSLFLDKSLEVFRTTDGAQAPDTYVLGDGDEIRITIFGASQTDIQQRIATDGSIQPTGVAKIFLKGLTLAQAREMVRERLSLAYSFRADQFAISIVTARTIMVNVFGEVKITGGFTISALNSAINALSAAGGPTEIGTVRAIQHIRGNTRKTIDLYTFMSDPTAQFKFDLQNNDIIFVPVLKTLVSIEGAVNRPMDYEMLPNETLADLIKFAGGLKMNAYPEFVQIKRFVNGEERLLEYNLEEVNAGKIKVALMNGDEVRIKSINKPMDQYVDISGSVYYPGRFDLSSNPVLRTLVNNAKPNFYAKTDILFLERIRPDETVEVLTLPFPKDNDTTDFVLQPRDKVRIAELSNFRDVAPISVRGHVRSPFEKNFAFNDRLTVKQAIEMADGLKVDAYPIAYVLRYNLYNPKEKTYLRIDLVTSDEFVLSPGDQLIIFDKKTFTETEKIAVTGEVRNPFEQTFAYTDRMTISKAIELAGGLKANAYPVAYVLRQDIFNPKQKTYLRYELESSGDSLLLPGDHLYVYDKNTFIDTEKITVSGQVRNPFEQTFAFTDRLPVNKAIELAGGLKPTAYPVAYIFRRNLINPLEMQYIRIELNQADSILLQPGDQLNIYDNTTYTNIGEVRVSGAVKAPRTFTYDSTLTIHDVLATAGGFQVGAAFNRVEVFRTKLSPTEKPRLEMITVKVDSTYHVVSPKNFNLQPYDHVVVRLTPEFTMGRYVEINGQVKYPGVYLLESKQTQLDDIIRKAGGLLKDADPKGSSLFRTYRNRGNISMNVRKAMRYPGSLQKNPVLFEGDIININRLENTVTILGNGTRMAQYSITDDVTKKNMVFQGRRSAAWYVKNFAGGFDEEADRNSVTVTLQNNQMKSTKKFFWCRDYPTVESGATISIMMKPPKEEEKVKEKKEIDWGNLFSQTLSATTSAATMFLLFRQISNTTTNP
jgi:protein involved in polysaccharide export with SLBB domain